jgi:RNA polymerase sigma-70 factor (ECF subfamily)
MPASSQSIPTDALQAEWQEIQAAQRDPAQFRALYIRYYDPIFRYVFRRTADETVTADLCSQVFLRALQNLRDYEYRGVPFSAWLYRIAGNEIAQYYRSTQRNRVVSAPEETLPELAEEMEVTPELAWTEVLPELLETLPEQDLRLIELRFFEQRPFKEVAAILEIRESNAKVKTYRILQRLKKTLVARGLDKRLG